MNETPRIELTCPFCGPGARLVIRTNRASGRDFVGCERWPKCDHTQPLTPYLEAVRRGDPTLPGF